MASIKFEKFKKLTRADVTVSEDLDSVTIDVYGKNADEPVASTTLDDFRSSEFMQTASDAYNEMPEKSKMHMFSTDLVPGKKNIWNVRRVREDTLQKLHPDQYLEYGIYAHLNPILNATNPTIMRLLAEVVVQLVAMKGDVEALKDWFPSGIVYNGVFVRSGPCTSGKLPSGKQLAKWNPTEMSWR
jgi:hypothetical protein